MSSTSISQVGNIPPYFSLNKVGSIVPLEKPSDIRKFDSSSYQAHGACFNPYTAFLRRFQDLRQAVVLFELAWLDFHELVLMDDLWYIGNHDFVVEMNAHRNNILSWGHGRQSLSYLTLFCLFDTRSEEILSTDVLLSHELRHGSEQKYVQKPYTIFDDSRSQPYRFTPNGVGFSFASK
ncbi:hypothetical protein Tco_0680747 [Tanacetum coccineum]|uniref:Uncharacterized protein n=1 Tax=Tanacetum coccineum TaxID=301880 RepID=A0ABQ4XMN7_9ASTR